MRRILWGLCFMVGMASTVVWAGASSAEKSELQIKYYRLYPDFITNLQAQNRLSYVLVRVEVAAKGKKNIQLVKDNEALLRDKIILLLNGKTTTEVSRGQMRKRLKRQMLDLLQKTMSEETGNPVVTNVLFTKFQVESP